jgi:hypothetical protein
MGTVSRPHHTIYDAKVIHYVDIANIFVGKWILSSIFVCETN